MRHRYMSRYKLITLFGHIIIYIGLYKQRDSWRHAPETVHRCKSVYASGDQNKACSAKTDFRMGAHAANTSSVPRSNDPPTQNGTTTSSTWKGRWTQAKRMPIPALWKVAEHCSACPSSTSPVPVQKALLDFETGYKNSPFWQPME